VKYFEFTGGEPFLIQEHFDLLQRAVELGHARNISIHYNTNGTTWPDDQVWKHFKNVEIAFSIDNIGRRFEIERSGASWADVQHNITQAKQLRTSVGNVILQVCITINIQNVLYLEDICHWVSEQQFDMIYFNMLHDPPHMNIANMTPTAKHLVIAKLQAASVDARFQNEIDSVIRFIEQGAGSDGVQFVEFMKRTDANRREDFAQTHTEIAKAMGYGS
jgi:MoaA/NifB/PqqE/SkfB family radical SAM enzyme